MGVDVVMDETLTQKNIRTRLAQPSDYERIISVMPSWWNGRNLTALLPELFLLHFYDTSFIVEQGGELIGFLVGFMSQSRQDEAYIHFIGIHPDFRQQAIGAALYERFFEICRRRGRSIVRAQTSPVNTGSVKFHAKMGFQVEYKDKVKFTKYL
ncbi:MAG: GNAT family N-acetyltransferase [Anaerolineales bacterium]|nr:GNAT family N-acetyltransferase [Anaerolineales bacterium]